MSISQEDGKIYEKYSSKPHNKIIELSGYFGHHVVLNDHCQDVHTNDDGDNEVEIGTENYIMHFELEWRVVDPVRWQILNL